MNDLLMYMLGVSLVSTVVWMAAFGALLFSRRSAFEGRL